MMGDFNGEDRKRLNQLDVRMAVVETKVSDIKKGMTYVLAILIGGLLLAILKVVFG